MCGILKILLEGQGRLSPLFGGIPPSFGKKQRREGNLIICRIRHMPLDRAKKDQIIKKFKVHDKDTGSAEVQIAILTEEISQLTEHLKTHKKDFSSRRGLLMKIGQRRRLLKYLEKQNPSSFEKLTGKLKLKK